MRAVHFYLSVLCAICIYLILYVVLYIWFIWQFSACVYREHGALINAILNLECILEIFVARDEVYRINYAGWLFVLIIPVATFFSTPYTKSRKRMLIILVAILCGYVLLSVSMLHASAIERYNYKEFQGKFTDDYFRNHAGDTSYSWIQNTINNTSLLLFGWLLTPTYTSICEIIWRIYYWRTIRRMGKQFKGRWFSNLLIIGIFIPWILIYLLFHLLKFLGYGITLPYS